MSLQRTCNAFPSVFTNMDLQTVGATAAIAFSDLGPSVRRPFRMARLEPGEALTALALDAALDAFQLRPAAPAVVLIVDTNGAGAFLSACHGTPGQQRAVMTSGRESDGALFLAPPTLSSFSQKVVCAAWQGNTLKTAFQAGREFLRCFQSIEAQLDDNGDGVSDKWDGALAGALYLGRRYAYAGGEAAGLPFVLEAWAVPQGAQTLLRARLMEEVAPSRVFAQILPPGSGGGSAPVGDVPEYDLAREAPELWRWSAQVPAALTPLGCSIAFYAVYGAGAVEKLSEPFLLTLDEPPSAIGAHWRLFR